MCLHAFLVLDLIFYMYGTYVPALLICLHIRIGAYEYSDLRIVYELYIIILCMYIIIIILCTYIGVFILHTTDNVTVFPSIVTFIIKLSNFYL